MIPKNAAEAGADERTPSVPQYFSWISSTNEGSCEKQTLINLDFFGWLKKTYGMQIKIYAWDAGNFDGAGLGYGDPEGPKFRAQYPGDTPPSWKRRRDTGSAWDFGAARTASAIPPKKQKNAMTS